LIDQVKGSVLDPIEHKTVKLYVAMALGILDPLSLRFPRNISKFENLLRIDEDIFLKGYLSVAQD
jgi:hypothetical protein